MACRTGLSQAIRAYEYQAGRSNDQQAGAPQFNIELLRRYAYYTTAPLQHTITYSVSRSLLDRHILTAHPIRELLPLGLWFQMLASVYISKQTGRARQ